MLLDWLRPRVPAPPPSPPVAVTPPSPPPVVTPPTPTTPPTVPAPANPPPVPTPLRLPAAVLDFGHTGGWWKLQYAPNPPNSLFTEVKTPAELALFERAPYFHTVRDVDGLEAVQFQVHSGAATSPGSTYPRSELRELKNSKGDLAAWDATHGVHELIIDGRILWTPDAKPNVVIGQIHDSKNDLIEVCPDKAGDGLKIICRVLGSSEHIPIVSASYKPGEKYRLMIRAQNGFTSVFWNNLVNPVLITAKVISKDCYFKCGNYLNSHADDAAVLITRISVNHSNVR